MVILNGQEVGSAQFAFNSVLTWTNAAGYNAWLQFMVLPGGPAFVGKLHRTSENDVTGACLVSCMFLAHKACRSPDYVLFTHATECWLPVAYQALTR